MLYLFQVVCECCEGAEPGPAMDRLLRRMRDGALSEGGLLTLLHAVLEKDPSLHSPQLLSLLEEMERQAQQGNIQTGGTSERAEVCVCGRRRASWLVVD